MEWIYIKRLGRWVGDSGRYTIKYQGILHSLRGPAGFMQGFYTEVAAKQAAQLHLEEEKA